MTTQIGLVGAEVTVADPSMDYRYETFAVKAEQRTGAGALVSDYVAVKHRFHLVWRGLTNAQRDAILTETSRLSHLSLYPPHDDTTAYTIAVTDVQVEAEIQPERWRIELECEEV